MKLGMSEVSESEISNLRFEIAGVSWEGRRRKISDGRFPANNFGRKIGTKKFRAENFGPKISRGESGIKRGKR